MIEDAIAEVGINTKGGLYIRPETAKFPLIWREVMEVRWDPPRERLFGPPPREWSYERWFRQLVDAAWEYGVTLRLHAGSVWVNVPTELRVRIEATAAETMIRNNARAIARMGDDAKQGGYRLAQESLAYQVRPKAADAFRHKDYAKAAALYESILPSLSPAEIGKLKYARSRGAR